MDGRGEAETKFLEAFGVLYEAIRKDLRAKGKKANQTIIARELEVSNNQVSAWLRSQPHGISLATVNRIAAKCQLPVARLFMGVEVLAIRMPAAEPPTARATDTVFQQGLTDIQGIVEKLLKNTTEPARPRLSEAADLAGAARPVTRRRRLRRARP